MAIVYRYVLKEKVVDYLKYGIRLSKQFDKEVILNGYWKQCITALLNPKDNIEKFNSENYVGLKIEVSPDYCKIVETSNEKENLKAIEYKDYILGTYKNPEVLITTSILPEKISVLNKDIDVPVLYDNSQDYYYACRITEMLEEMSPKNAYEALKTYTNNQ